MRKVLMVLAMVCAVKAVAVTVEVWEGSDVRQAVPIDKGPKSETLRIQPYDQKNWELHSASIYTAQDQTLWKQMSVDRSQATFNLVSAYSSQEYVYIQGALVKKATGNGGYRYIPPNFKVTVPSADIDWSGHSHDDDEATEDDYIEILPLTEESSQWKTVIVRTPRDKPSSDNTVSFRCEPVGAIRLYDGNTEIRPNTLMTRGDFRVEPLIPGEFKIILEGKTSSLDNTKAKDVVRGCVVDIKLITPSGDPVNAPVQSGDGQNEFVYSAANPGVLTVNLKASVMPSSALSKVQDDVSFTVDNILGATMQWSAQNPNGKATVNNGFLCATVTFTDLPGVNASFGLKTARVFYDSVKKDEKNYEVFFPRDANNNPGVMDVPNWFYYWKQTSANGANTVMIYTNSGGSEYLFPGIIYIGATAVSEGRATWGSPKGIDRFAWTTRHEAKHHTQLTGFWPTGYDSARDFNGNWIPDEIEATYMSGRYFNSNGHQYSDEFGYGENPISDVEDICMRSQTPPYSLDVLWNNGYADTEDWASPGKQSKDKF